MRKKTSVEMTSNWTPAITGQRLSSHTDYSAKRNDALAAPLGTVEAFPKVESVQVSFQFKKIGFSKKRIASLVLAAEMLTSQRPFINSATRQYLRWSLRKGDASACTVSLSKKNMIKLMEKLRLESPRQGAKWAGLRVKNKEDLRAKSLNRSASLSSAAVRFVEGIRRPKRISGSQLSDSVYLTNLQSRLYVAAETLPAKTAKKSSLRINFLYAPGTMVSEEMRIRMQRSLLLPTYR